MHDWQLVVASQAGMVGLLAQNLLQEGTIIALEEALQVAQQLCDSLAHVRQETLERNGEQGEGDMKRSRKLRIGEMGARYSVYHYGTRHSVPQIRLQGKWLREAGFVAGEHVTVVVEHGRLVLQTTEDTVETEG